MSGRICTRYRDDDGLDVGCHLLSKEYMIENYPSLVDQAKVPGLWLWGAGCDGQIGDDTLINRSSPVQTISGGTNWRSITAGNFHNAAIKTDGTLWTWGFGTSGQNGDNTNITRSSPVQTISGGTNWRSVSVGGRHTVSIKTDGTLWTWGFGTSGQLGNNVATNRSSPVQTISGGANWKSVSAGGCHTAAIKTDGSLWLWGQGDFGGLGNSLTTNQSSPVQTISGGTNWRSVSNHSISTAAIKTDGTLWTWGENGTGKLGNNSIISQSSPVQTISGGTNWKVVSMGGRQMAAIKIDGTLWVWGQGVNGELGNNTSIGQSSPVQTISGGTNWRSVVSSQAHTASIKTDGSLWLWGYNGSGRLGNGLVAQQSSPVQTISGGTNWRSVSASNLHTAAIKDLGDF
jgi:hypothetical protein